MTEPLSPAAQAILDAAHNRWLDVDDDIPAQVAAAALRAATEQVVPDAANYLRAAINSSDWWDAHDQIRAKLLAIAAELEGAK